MALVRIDYAHPKPDSFAATLAREVERAMATVLSVPGAENYLVCQGHPAICCMRRATAHRKSSQNWCSSRSP